MPPKIIHFLAGMPRAGATLLANILMQNPAFHATPCGGLVQWLVGQRATYDAIPELRLTAGDESKMGALRGALHGFFEPIDRPVVITHDPLWVFEIEMAEVLLSRPVKVIVCVRDIPEILASLEMQWRQNKAFRLPPQHESNRVAFLSLPGRLDAWLEPSAPAGKAYVGIQDALTRGFADRLHFVHFDHLTRNPAATLQRLYRFLQEPPFAHDFEHVGPVVATGSAAAGAAAEQVRPAVRPVPSRARQVLGPLADKYKGPFIWDAYLSNGKG